MKKVSFKKGIRYDDREIECLPEEVINDHFDNADYRNEYDYICTESFTAEITVKIVPYEQQ